MNSIGKLTLGTLTKLGDGAQGNVFIAPGVQLRLQGKVFGQAVYKEYHNQTLHEVDASVLQEMVTFVSSLSFSDGVNITNRAAWPVCLVEERGNILGFLMPCIPPQFTISFPLPSGKSKRIIAGFQMLLNDSKYLSYHRIRLTDLDRYKLLYELAASLNLFHDYDIAVGDLSPRNVLYSLLPDPSVYFIDCDSMRFRSKSALRQIETPDWNIRAISHSEDIGTPQTDRYKFGLFVLRLFAGHQTTRDFGELPSRVPGEIRTLVRMSLSTNMHSRPEMEEWLAPLQRAINPNKIAPPPPLPLPPSPFPPPYVRSIARLFWEGFDPFGIT